MESIQSNTEYDYNTTTIQKGFRRLLKTNYYKKPMSLFFHKMQWHVYNMTTTIKPPLKRKWNGLIIKIRKFYSA